MLKLGRSFCALAAILLLTACGGHAAETVGNLSSDSYPVSEFNDKGTVIVFAHQDDDLLWMYPFWGPGTPLIRGAYLSAYPISPDLQQVVSALPAAYVAVWASLFGATDAETFHSVYLVPCKREKIVTIDAVKALLRPRLADPAVTRIVTHNNWGEYGHAQHRLVNRAVRELAVELKKDVWTPAWTADRGTYVDQGTFGGLPSIFGSFDAPSFKQLRGVYEAHSDCLPNGQCYRSTWTWSTGENDFPQGKQRYLKIVDHGKDLTIGNAGIEAVSKRLPVINACMR